MIRRKYSTLEERTIQAALSDVSAACGKSIAFSCLLNGPYSASEEMRASVLLANVPPYFFDLVCMGSITRYE